MEVEEWVSGAREKIKHLCLVSKRLYYDFTNAAYLATNASMTSSMGTIFYARPERGEILHLHAILDYVGSGEFAHAHVDIAVNAMVGL
jgi:hypothetical protein